MGLLLIIIFGLFLPRVILFCCWLFGVFSGVWQTILWPVLGFIFLPYTTLAYGLAHTYGDGLQGIWLAVLIFGVMLDVGSSGKTAGGKRRPQRS